MRCDEENKIHINQLIYLFMIAFFIARVGINVSIAIYMKFQITIIHESKNIEKQHKIFS